MFWPVAYVNPRAIGSKRNIERDYNVRSRIKKLVDEKGSVIKEWAKELGLLGVRALRAALFFVVAVMMRVIVVLLLGAHKRVGFRLIVVAHQKV